MVRFSPGIEEATANKCFRGVNTKAFDCFHVNKIVELQKFICSQAHKRNNPCIIKMIKQPPKSEANPWYGCDIRCLSITLESTTGSVWTHPKHCFNFTPLTSDLGKRDLSRLGGSVLGVTRTCKGGKQRCWVCPDQNINHCTFHGPALFIVYQRHTAGESHLLWRHKLTGRINEQVKNVQRQFAVLFRRGLPQEVGHKSRHSVSQAVPDNRYQLWQSFKGHRIGLDVWCCQHGAVGVHYLRNTQISLTSIGGIPTEAWPDSTNRVH